MPNYIGPDDDPTDPDDLAEAAFDSLVEYIDGYVPDDNSLEAWLVVVISRIAATNADVAKQMPLAAFRYFGETIVGLQPQDDIAATATLTVTATDTLGYTIPAGTNVGYAATGDTIVPFQVVDDVVIPPGQISTAAGAVAIVALTAGSTGNGYVSDQIVLLDPLAWVTSITATAPTAGGVDGETDDAYIQRLSAELQLYTPTPILPDDFATMARSISGVARACGVANYNPADGTTNNQRMVGVCVVDDNGEPLSSGTKAAVETYLQSLRELNFIVNVFDPSYTTVNVVFTFTPFTSADPATVLADAIEAVATFLNPITWGVDPDDTTGATWEDTNIVHRSALSGALLAVDGLRWVDSMTINGSTAEEVTIAGPGSLPAIGSITGTQATS